MRRSLLIAVLGVTALALSGCIDGYPVDGTIPSPALTAKAHWSQPCPNPNPNPSFPVDPSYPCSVGISIAMPAGYQTALFNIAFPGRPDLVIPASEQKYVTGTDDIDNLGQFANFFPPQGVLFCIKARTAASPNGPWSLPLQSCGTVTDSRNQGLTLAP